MAGFFLSWLALQQVEGDLFIFRSQQTEQRFDQAAPASRAGAEGVRKRHIHHESVTAFHIGALTVKIGKLGRFPVGFTDDRRRVALGADDFQIA